MTSASHAYALFAQGVSAEDAGDPSMAMDAYRKALAIDPNHSSTLINLGSLCYHQRDFSQAVAMYRRACAIDPAYALAHFNLGTAVEEVGDLDSAIEAYLRALELDPRYADAHYNLARVYDLTGRHLAALPHWRRYAQLDRSGAWADFARASVRKIVEGQRLKIVGRSDRYIPRTGDRAALFLVNRESAQPTLFYKQPTRYQVRARTSQPSIQRRKSWKSEISTVKSFLRSKEPRPSLNS